MSLKARELLKKKRLGEILKSLDFIDDKKLEEILEQQKETHMKLGEVLTSMGYVDKEVVLSLVGKQLGNPYIRLSEVESIDEEILRHVPRNIAEKNMVFPFGEEDGYLKVAMAEPQEDEVRAAISILTNMEVEVYISSEEEIQKAIDKYYK